MMNTNMSMTIATLRHRAIETFRRVQFRARISFLMAGLFKKPVLLSSFAAALPHLNNNRIYAGVQDIRIEQIVGSVGRSGDFDRYFRPLKSHLRDRWVSLYLLLETRGWEPIMVYKVDDTYYVEDGHHRVSVARSTGMAFIQAVVWEYTYNAELVGEPAPEPTDHQQPGHPLDPSEPGTETGNGLETGIEYSTAVEKPGKPAGLLPAIEPAIPVPNWPRRPQKRSLIHWPRHPLANPPKTKTGQQNHQVAPAVYECECRAACCQ